MFITAYFSITMIKSYVWDMTMIHKEEVLHESNLARPIIFLYLYYQLSEVLYIGNFSRGFNFCWVCNLPESAKNKRSEK